MKANRDVDIKILHSGFLKKKFNTARKPKVACFCIKQADQQVESELAMFGHRTSMKVKDCLHVGRIKARIQETKIPALQVCVPDPIKAKGLPDIRRM